MTELPCTDHEEIPNGMSVLGLRCTTLLWLSNGGLRRAGKSYPSVNSSIRDNETLTASRFGVDHQFP